MRPPRPAAALAVFAVVVAGVVAPTWAATHNVSMTDNVFTPANLTVAPGDTVTWTHNGIAPHTVTWEDGAPGSGQRFRTQTYSRRFDAAGSFRYFCENHRAQGMAGVVTVTGAPSAPAPTAAPTTTTTARRSTTTTTAAAATTPTSTAPSPATPPPDGDFTTTTTSLFPPLGASTTTFDVPPRTPSTLAARPAGDGAARDPRELAVYGMLALGALAGGLTWRRSRDRRLLETW